MIHIDPLAHPQDYLRTAVATRPLGAIVQDDIFFDRAEVR